jgi:uncharacterized protein with von Willebrand factor type A (vWA) domain
MAQEVRDSGISISDAETEQAMKQYADSAFPTREAFYQYLERSGIKVSEYKADIAQQMASERLMRSSIGEIVVSEDEAAAFYDSVKNLFFRRPAGFMVNFASFASPDEAEKARNLLLEGQPWVEVTGGAASDDAVSSDVTNLVKPISATAEPTFIPESAFDGAFSPMKSDDVGVVSAVFEVASDDFVVGVKTEAVEETVSSYDEVSADIRAIIQQQKEREALSAFSQTLLDRARVVILDTSLFPSEVRGVEEFLPVSAPETDDADNTDDADENAGESAPGADSADSSPE